MALEKIGVKLVAEDGQAYIATLIEAAGASDGLKSALGGFSGAAGGAAASGGALSGVLAAVGIAAGAALVAVTAVVGGVVALGAGLVGLVRKAIPVTAEFESLSMSMSSLIAKEIRAEDATLSMSQALDQAGDKAGQLLGWIEMLAIKSPFDQRGVALAYKTALAYGFTTVQAQGLTEALVNYATASGKTSAVVQQLAYPLGQIRASGKLMRQDLLQLQNAGVGVVEILAQMGFSYADVSKGIVSSDAFLKQFVETMNDDFGGAAERSAGTINGLTNSIEDLGQIGLRQAFGPAIQAAVPLLQIFVDKLMAILPAVQAFGEGLGYLVSVLVGEFLPAAETSSADAARTWTGHMAEINDDTQSLAENMFDNGANLVLQFAEGMASAINKVLDVLLSLGTAIAKWLSPGSPPKITPDIDDWGTAAMDEFIGGFMKADFGVFKKMSGMIEKVMRSGAGKDNKGLIPAILGARGAVGTALAEINEIGRVSETTMEHLNDILGDANQETKEYAKALFDVTIAQKKLNEITEQARKTLAPMQEELSQIAKRRESITNAQRGDALAQIINDENAPALAKELAMMELREMQLKAQMSAVEENANAEAKAVATELDAAQKKLEMQELLIDTQLETNKLIKEQIELMKRLNAGGAGGGGGGGAGAGKGLGGLPSLGGGLGSLGGTIGEGISAGFEDKMEGLKTKLNEIIDPLKEKIKRLGLVFGTVGDLIKAKWGEVVSFFQIRFKAFGDIFTIHLPRALELARINITEWITETKEKFGLWITETKEAFTIWWGELVEGFTQFFEDTFTPMDQWLTDMGERILKFIDATLLSLGDWFKEVKDMMIDLRDEGVDWLRAGLESLKRKIDDVAEAIRHMADILASVDLGDLWEMVSHSPSPLERGVRGATRAMREFGSVAPVAIPQTRVVSQAGRGGSRVTNNQFQMGGNNIQSPMDMALMEAMITRVVGKAIA